MVLRGERIFVALMNQSFEMFASVPPIGRGSPEHFIAEVIFSNSFDEDEDADKIFGAEDAAVANAAAEIAEPSHSGCAR